MINCALRILNAPPVPIIARMTWPALRLAANRKDNVIGRISELIVSTALMKYLIIIGVFGGKWWLFIFFVFVVDIIISLVHSTTPILIVNDK